MFVPKSRQKTIFDLEFGLPEEMLKRIKQTWASVFLQVIMPLLIKAEEQFADLYNKSNGAPNTPVALLLGVLILKDIFDLTDNETLEHLEYNLLWQYALDIRFEDAHICRKTLHNFRTKLLESGRHRRIFNLLTKKIIELFGLNIGHQRLDSTHIIGKMKIVGRLGLFVQTIEQFLFKLKRMAKKDSDIARIIEELPEQFHKRYLEREGYFGDARGSQASRKLQTCAEDIWELLEIFKNDPKISKLKQFKTLKRLFKEQCEIVNPNDKQAKIKAKLPEIEEQKPTKLAEDIVAPLAENPIENETLNCRAKISETDEQKPVDQTPIKNVATPSSETPVQDKASARQQIIEVKDKRKVGTDSLQSPTDPDATYGHKGKGYEFQVAETCDRDNPFQVITETHLNGANESDQTQTIPMIEKLDKADLKPEELQADAGYVSGKNIIDAQDRGTELIGPLPGKPASVKVSLGDFEFDEDGSHIERCPNQKSPVQQGDTEDKQAHWAVFSKADCSDCPFCDDCPVKGKRTRRIEWNREKLATAKRRKEVTTREFKEKYKIRSGIEATNSELKNKHGAANLKVRGYQRINLAMMLKSLAVNVKRMIIYVLSESEDTDAGGAKNHVSAMIRILTSLLLVFIGIARACRPKTFSALKGSNLRIYPFHGINFLAMCFCLSEA